MIHKTLVQPCVTLRAEAWTITEAHAEALRFFERIIYRRICSPVKEEEVRKIRLNNEINIIIGEENTVRYIKVVIWEDGSGENLEKDYVCFTTFGIRKRGRPRKRLKKIYEKWEWKDRGRLLFTGRHRGRL